MHTVKIWLSKSYFPREITEKDIWRTFIQVIDKITMYNPIRKVIWLQEIKKSTLLSDLKNLIRIVWIEENMIIVENTIAITTFKKPPVVEDTKECALLITYP